MPITFPTSEGGKEKGNFQSCIDNNKDKQSPGGFCNHLEDLQAKLGFLKLSNMTISNSGHRSAFSDFEKKKKKKTDIHLLLNTPISGMSAKLQSLKAESALLQLAADFEESKHPRDKGGEFTTKGGEGAGGKKDDKPAERFKHGEKIHDQFDDLSNDEKGDLLIDAGGYSAEQAQEIAESSFFKDLDPQDQDAIAKTLQETTGKVSGENFEFGDGSKISLTFVDSVAERDDGFVPKGFFEAADASNSPRAKEIAKKAKKRGLEEIVILLTFH